ASITAPSFKRSSKTFGFVLWPAANIKGGADVNLQDELGARTPLMFAAGHNTNPKVLELLLKEGAVIDAAETVGGRTPLMLAAAYNENPAVITLLLEQGADGSLRSRAGKTAYAYARGNRFIQNSPVLGALRKAQFKA
ncbi:MAG TPA: ankyrin repeat domain-containing protein, partial [Firmicutes bacterium]|nr:ankyrin repeat domain-containing protein [Bacillota bacterium]